MQVAGAQLLEAPSLPPRVYQQEAGIGRTADTWPQTLPYGTGASRAAWHVLCQTAAPVFHFFLLFLLLLGKESCLSSLTLCTNLKYAILNYKTIFIYLSYFYKFIFVFCASCLYNGSLKTAAGLDSPKLFLNTFWPLPLLKGQALEVHLPFFGLQHP